MYVRLLVARSHFTLLAASLLLLAPALGCEERSPPAEAVIRPVRVVRIAEAGASMRQSLAGVARASKEMSLSFRVAGTLEKLKIKMGDEVKKGALIASLDTKDALIDIERAKASVARATAEYRSAQADFERTKSLYADGSASRSELDAGRALAESSRAMLSVENKGLEMARSKLADHTLKAPLLGGIAEVNVEVNENVQSGQRIALLNAGEKIEVEVAVPERVIELFRKGSSAVVRFDAMKGELFEGTISEVGLASASGSVGFPVRVALLKVDKRIRAGMAALVTLDLVDSDDAARIFAPPAALLEDNQETHYVLIAKPSEGEFAQVERRDVTIGEPSSLGVAIESGLKGGEQVIVAGLSQISVGMKVRLLTAEQPALAKERLKGSDSVEGGASPAAPTLSPKGGIVGEQVETGETPASKKADAPKAVKP